MSGGGPRDPKCRDGWQARQQRIAGLPAADGWSAGSGWKACQQQMAGTPAAGAHSLPAPATFGCSAVAICDGAAASAPLPPRCPHRLTPHAKKQQSRAGALTQLSSTQGSPSRPGQMPSHNSPPHTCRPCAQLHGACACLGYLRGGRSMSGGTAAAFGRACGEAVHRTSHTRAVPWLHTLWLSPGFTPFGCSTASHPLAVSWLRKSCSCLLRALLVAGQRGLSPPPPPPQAFALQQRANAPGGQRSTLLGRSRVNLGTAVTCLSS
eukprot:349918-Chlamydomonas_euryale.AAC.4